MFDQVPAWQVSTWRLRVTHGARTGAAAAGAMVGVVVEPGGIVVTGGLVAVGAGAATAQRDAAGEPRAAGDAAAIDRHLDASRTALGPDQFAAAETAGAALDLEAALAEVLAR